MLEQEQEQRLSDIHRNGRQKDSVGRVAAISHTSSRQVQAVLDYFDIPKTARDRIYRTIVDRNR